MEHYQLAALRPPENAYVEFLRKADLSMGVYRLSAGAEDKQKPHSEDEVYFVTSGRAHFRAGDRELAVKPGDILFVPAGEPHRFFDIREDLEVLVFFGPAEGSRTVTR